MVARARVKEKAKVREIREESDKEKAIRHKKVFVAHAPSKRCHICERLF